MPKLSGSVDFLGRPIVRVAVIGCEDEITATIDTGFNGELMTTLDAALKIGVSILENSETVRLGDNSSVDVRLGRVWLDWLGETREVSVFVSGSRMAARGPLLLVGTRLLSPHLLLIDFEAGLVEIETQG